MASNYHSYVMVNEGEDRKVAFVQRSIGSNTVEQSEVAVTLPYIATHRFTAGPVRLATASSHIFQFMGSGLNRTLLRFIEVTQVGNATASQQLEVEIRRLDTRGTGGTAVTPVPNDPIDSASTATGMVLPSSKGTEDELLAKKSGPILTTAATAGHERVVKFTFPESGDPTTKPLIFAAGSTTGFALKNIQSDVTATVLITGEYQEVFWG